MTRYNPVIDPNPKDKTTTTIHKDINKLTSDSFDGITALNGSVNGVLGDLSDNDIESIEEYLGVSLEQQTE